MLCAIGRSILYPFLALARLVPRLTPGFFRAFGFSAFGLWCLLLPSSMLAGEVTLAWDPTQDPNLAGYRIYYGYASGSYEGVLDVGNETAYTLTDLEEGQAYYFVPYYFVLVAYGVYGEENAVSEESVYDGPTRDSEEDREENTLPDQNEADQAESDREAVLEAAREMDADETDTIPALEEDSEDEQDYDRSGARCNLHVNPQSALRIASVDSETLVGDGAAESAIDDRGETFWHTERGAGASIHPHELVIALGGEYMVRGFRYLPRQDGEIDGMVGRYSFYVSEDGKDWGKAVTTGTFSRDIAAQEVTFPGKLGSFVRFVPDSEVSGKPWTRVAELNVLGVC